jgi:hypothetical protein
VDEVIKILSMETVSSNLYESVDKKDKSKKENEEMTKYKSELSDHLILMKLMNEWKDLTNNQKKEWCI